MVARESSECESSQGIVVIVPTLERQELLLELLQNLRRCKITPTAVVVVDSSNVFIDQSQNFQDIHLKHIKFLIKSAASQRNRAIELILSENLDFEYVAFLDDDIELGQYYFKQLLNRFKHNPDFVGISGLAKNQGIIDRKRNFLSDFLGLTGRAGCITKALVNISPEGIKEFKEVDWLIGCSMWRRIVIENVTFEVDFQGQSLFEDVIFSYKAKSFGKIGFDPEVSLKHLLSPKGRPNEILHYRAWITNRYRMFTYSKDEFSRFSFWLLNYFLFFSSLVKALFNGRARKKMIGILLGIKDVIREKKSL